MWSVWLLVSIQLATAAPCSLLPRGRTEPPACPGGSPCHARWCCHASPCAPWIWGSNVPGGGLVELLHHDPPCQLSEMEGWEGPLRGPEGPLQ